MYLRRYLYFLKKYLKIEKNSKNIARVLNEFFNLLLKLIQDGKYPGAYRVLCRIHRESNYLFDFQERAFISQTRFDQSVLFLNCMCSSDVLAFASPACGPRILQKR